MKTVSDYFHMLHFASETDQVIHANVKSHFLALIGMELDYYGADAGDHTFNIDNIVFRVLEDPDDGYRSHLGPIDYSNAHSSVFFKQPIAKVRIEGFNDEYTDDRTDSWSHQLDRGYRLIDVNDSHIWLEFGTANYDDYYPCFMFRHYPKGKK